jgi:CRP-like cAMP-binding protein
MESDSVSELFPLFNTATPETIEWFLSVSEKQNYPANSLLVSKEDWGKDVIFIVSGWVNIGALSRDQEITLDILAEGDYFGEIAVLDDFPPLASVITLSDVQLIKISAQRFLQMLFKSKTFVTFAVPNFNGIEDILKYVTANKNKAQILRP